MRNHDLESAVSSFEQAVRLEPRHAASWDGLMHANMALDRADEVARVVQRRLQLEPNDPKLFRILTDAERRAGHKEEFAAALKRLKELNPYLGNRAQIGSTDQTNGDARQ